MTPLEEVQSAMTRPDVRLVPVTGFNIRTGRSLQGLLIERKPAGSTRWVKVGTVIYPSEDQTLGDVAKMLLDMREEALTDG